MYIDIPWIMYFQKARRI